MSQENVSKGIYRNRNMYFIKGISELNDLEREVLFDTSIETYRRELKTGVFQIPLRMRAEITPKGSDRFVGIPGIRFEVNLELIHKDEVKKEKLEYIITENVIKKTEID